MDLGLIGNSAGKKIYMLEVQSIESNFQSIESCRYSPINSTITQFQFYK